MKSLQVKNALKQLGNDIQIARKKRRMSVADFCDRIGVTDKTLAKLENGDGGVRVETFVMSLFVLGMIDKFSLIANESEDITGLWLDRKNIPKRIRRRRLTESKNNYKISINADDEGTTF